MAAPNSDHSNTEERLKQLRQLEHDTKNYLGVISTGMQALAGVRDDPETFDELHTTIEEEGIAPLKQVIADLIAVACREE